MGTEMEAEFKKFDDAAVDELVQQGVKAYALTNYEEAVEKLGEACQVYTKNHEKEDADLLFIYGKALFRVAVAQSEVLGGNQQKKPEELEQVEKVEQEEEKKAEPENAEEGDQPAAGEEGEEGEEGDEEKEEKDESDFEVAWEVLDLVRTLFNDQLQAATNDEEKQAVQKKLADVYDLLGEVSLESENFTQAVEDLTSSLNIKNALHKFTDPIVCEAHFKLALAYEFDFENDPKKENATKHMEQAIQSVKDSDRNDPELITDLQTRLDDMKSASPADEQSQVMENIMGTAQSALKSQLMNIVGQANDVSSLVRKKPETDDAESSSSRPQKEAKVDLSLLV